MSDLVRIDSIKVQGRHRKDFGDLTDLVTSIKDIGLLQPVLTTDDLHLIAGERRLRACQQIGMEEIPVRIVSSITDARDLLVAERDENTCRKEMTMSEKVSLAKAIEEMEKPKAAERQASQEFGRGVDNLGAAAPKLQNEDQRSDAIAAQAVGVSRDTFRRASRVIDAADDADETPEVRAKAAELVQGMDSGEKSAKGALRELNEVAGRPAESTSKVPGKKDPDDSRLTRKQPPKFGGNRKKHAAVIDSIAVSLSGLAMAADGITDLDASVTSEEAARLADDLSKSIRSLNRIKNNLYRKATS